jgi:hypothetical protein
MFTALCVFLEILVIQPKPVYEAHTECELRDSVIMECTSEDTNGHTTYTVCAKSNNKGQSFICIDHK